MREGMVRRRGLTSGGERLLVDLPETPTAGRTLAVVPQARVALYACLKDDLHEGVRATKTPRRAWTFSFSGRQGPRGAVRQFESTCLRRELRSMWAHRS